jgi:hypothetical protein
VTVSVRQCLTYLNIYGFPECISQPLLDNKTITLGETGGIVSLDLSKGAIPLVTSAEDFLVDLDNPMESVYPPVTLAVIADLNHK